MAILANQEQIPTILASKQAKSRSLLAQRHFEATILPAQKRHLMSRETDGSEKELVLQHLDHLIVAPFVLMHFKRTSAEYKKALSRKVPPGSQDRKSTQPRAQGVRELTD